MSGFHCHIMYPQPECRVYDSVCNRQRTHTADIHVTGTSHAQKGHAPSDRNPETADCASDRERCEIEVREKKKEIISLNTATYRASVHPVLFRLMHFLGIWKSISPDKAEVCPYRDMG